MSHSIMYLQVIGGNAPTEEVAEVITYSNTSGGKGVRHSLHAETLDK